MIVFVPAYDDATKSNLSIVNSILPSSCLLLSSVDATRDKIMNALVGNNIPLFVMSHGYVDYIYDNNDSRGISCNEITVFNNRVAYVYACYTANELGREAGKLEAIYWGYTGPIGAPNDSEETKESFIKIFSYIIGNFSNALAISEIKELIDNIKILCDEAQSHFYDVFGFGELQSHFAVRCIWNRLRVYHHGLNRQPIIHSEAQPDDLFPS